MESRQCLEEAAYLEEIIRKINLQIQKTKEALSHGKKEIDSMHEYYWQNYTEMDQYGYEDYDNQQALLEQVNANAQQAKRKMRLKRMLDSPYFGRVDFRYDGESETEKFYIGIGNFAEKNGAIPLIYDWRAPISGLFYDYDKGPASYQAPLGVMEGEVCSKRQYKIKDGKLVYVFESDTKIDDDILKAELGSNSDVQLKNIVRTIQKEQNAIIRNTRDKILVIQGAAGSGKTSIALHRIAYLLYHDRENLKSSNILILSPNSVFTDYISHILPELGEENICEMSFDLFAYRELKCAAGDSEDRYDDLERQMKFPDDEASLRFKEKQSAKFIGIMESFLAVLEDALVDFSPVEFKGLKKTEEELITLFYSKFQNTPLLKRMDYVMEYFIDEYETLHNRDISQEEREYIGEMFDRLYVTKDIYQIYSRMLVDSGYDALPDVEISERIIPYEDVYPMLYLKYRLCGGTSRTEIRHLVIDEMQDYSYLQYTILNNIFSCRMTILGDRAQTLDDTPQDVLTFLPKIFGGNIKKIIINKSYRNTVEIAEYAAKLSEFPTPELFLRHGRDVEEKMFSNQDALIDSIFENYQTKYETTAVLAATRDEAYVLFCLLKIKFSESGIPVAYIDRNSTFFKKGITVTTWYFSKGLEFDQVFSVFLNDSNPLKKQAAYISATRALHELYVYRL